MNLLNQKWEWVYTLTRGGDHLHHVDWDWRDMAVFEAATDRGFEGTSRCGLKRIWHPPGILSRLGRERCAHCCDLLGISRGYGNTANDSEARVVR